MILAALNLAIITVFFFIIGMIKPKWALFFLDKPDRMIVIAITAVLIMVSVTMYGEGHRRSTLATDMKSTGSKKLAPIPVPVPVPVPVKPETK